jgi:putative PIN family toxin of toxin-antitoxin system
MAPVVVFDTNVIFSAVGWMGRPYTCLERARQGVVNGVTSQVLLDELVEKLVEKLAFSEAQCIDTLADLLGYLQVIPTTEQITVITADDDDNRVLECARAANADFIVTGDRRHLLPLGSYQGIAIISPADFLNCIPSLEPN